MPQLPSLLYKTRLNVLAALKLNFRDWGKVIFDEMVQDIVSKLLNNMRQVNDVGKREISVAALRKHVMNMHNQEGDKQDSLSQLYAISHATRRFIIDTDFAIFAERIVTLKTLDAAYATSNSLLNPI
ncbi:MAG: hypothetical protein M1813_002554 [Trichoglossum hirsutum]|nr:MAG: hypothetical protein M1813_002554 [Trichoglossum hirsutum]